MSGVIFQGYGGMLSGTVRMQSVDDYLQKPQEIVDREVRLPKDGLESSSCKFIMHWNYDNQHLFSPLSL